MNEIYDTRGHRGYRQRLEQRARGAGPGRVIFTGFRRDMPAVTNSLDILVHASVRPEPFGRVILEAMACGRPVVATHAAGVPEVLGADRSPGLLVPPGDVAAMASAILQLLRDEGRRRRIPRAGRDRGVRLFSIEKHVRAVEKVYEEVLRRLDSRTRWGGALCGDGAERETGPPLRSDRACR